MKLLSTPLLLLTLAHLGSAALRAYDLTITSGIQAPDGFSRPVHLINGQTPGPHLTADEGDSLEVTVNNKITESFTIHFHGLEMRDSLWSDGVPGITQRLIQPNETFVYRFNANQHGLYWYHAHSRILYADGIRGTFYIRPNTANMNTSPFSLISNVASDITAMKTAHLSPKVLSVSDWMHIDSETDLREWNRTKVENICMSSILLNGKGRGICPPKASFTPYFNPVVPDVTARGCALPNNTILNPFPESRPDLVDAETWFNCKNTTSPLSIIEVKKTDVWASLAFVNVGALWDIKVSVDSHPFYIYSADGGYHQPQKHDVIAIAPGERYQAMIKLDQAAGDYAIRVTAGVTPQFISGYGVLTYAKTTTTGTVIPADKNPAMDYGSRLLAGKTQLAPMSLQVFPASNKPPQSGTVMLKFQLHRRNTNAWIMNNDPYTAHLEDGDPLLLNPSGSSAYDPDLVPTYPVGSVVDIVLVSPAGNPPHPIHKHGVKAWIIGQGYGVWSWTNVASAIAARPDAFNLVNPPYRDQFHTLDSNPNNPAFTVFRFKVQEAGAVFMHCHINLHVFGGMGVALMEGSPTFPTIPQYYRDWNAAVTAPWGQCGGTNYTGSVACPGGQKCQYYNDYWSQCVAA